MSERSPVLGVVVMAAAVLLVFAAASLLLWAGVAQPYGRHSIIFVVSPTLALVYGAIVLVAVRVALRRRR
ncbi:MAG: hypothetical protein V4479_10630 [Actinomycetota bacterium]